MNKLKHRIKPPGFDSPKWYTNLEKNMKKIVVASQNPVKINATLQGFQRMSPKERFKIEGISVSSGVSSQPQSDDETFQGTFMLPPLIAELVTQGKELGEAGDIVFGLANSRQGIGAVGALTNNVIDRTHYCEDAVVLALVPFKNEHLF